MEFCGRSVQELQAWSQLSDGSFLPISTEGMNVESVDTDASSNNCVETDYKVKQCYLFCYIEFYFFLS